MASEGQLRKPAVEGPTTSNELTFREVYVKSLVVPEQALHKGRHHVVLCVTVFQGGVLLLLAEDGSEDSHTQGQLVLDVLLAVALIIEARAQHHQRIDICDSIHAFIRTN